MRGQVPSPGIQVSIHAPVKGATLGHWPEDHDISVSIHAPVKGATLCTGRFSLQ